MDSTAVTVRVNQPRMQVKARPGTFLKVERTWREGDTLQVTFPMALHYEAIAPETPDRQALLYGPLLLVALSDKPVSMERGKTGVDVMRQGNALPSFRSHTGTLQFVPFFKVGEERYTTYFSTPAAP